MRSAVVIAPIALCALLACDPVVGPGDASSPRTDGVLWVVDARADDASAMDVAAADLVAVDQAALDLPLTEAAAQDLAAADTSPVDTAVADAAPVDVASADLIAPEAGDPVDAAGPDHAADAAVVDLGAQVDSAVASDAATVDAALGWPFDASLPAPCSSLDVSTDGTPWSGWANYQWPPALGDASGGRVEVGETTALAYGQVWQDGVTSSAGQATGWDAELLVGPWGTLPDVDGACWRSVPGTFNGDAVNNDEYRAALLADRPGLFGLLWRYRPSGGRWLYGDQAAGSDDGLQAAQAGVLEVQGVDDGRLVVATLNLRCRLDDWAARRPLVVDALARIQPDLVALQEDCASASEPLQSQELRELLARRTGRGYEVVHAHTHTASDVYQEGVSVLSAHAIVASHVLELPPTPVVAPALFPRKAVAVDVVVAGQALRFYGTHLEVGEGNQGTRQGQAAAIVADLPASGAVIVGGDLNATPDEAAVQTLAAALADLWARANPSDPGLTMPAWDPTRRIDYLFGRGPCVGALRGGRLLDERAGGTWLSDHRGVAATCAWP